MLKSHRHLLSSLLVLLFALTWAAPATADTAADIDKINGLLRRAESNLQSVEQNLAGRTSPPKGSAGKLLAQRLNQAYGDLEPAGKLVATLPAGEAGVAEVTERYNTNVTLYQKLAAVMNGGNAPAAETGPKDGEVKLGYPHADNFKNVLFTYRNKVEAPANQLTKLHAELLPVEDQLLINHRTAAQAMATLAEARRQAGFVEEGLAKIPANGQGVAAAKTNLAASLEQLQGSEDYFAPLHAKLSALVDPANYPQFNEDRKRLQDLGSQYKQDWVFTSDRAQAAELYVQRPAAQQELIRIAGQYQRLMQQQTEMGQTIEAVGNGALQSFQAFDAEIEAQKNTLPASIREDLAEADQYANEAVQNQKPAWFQGGIPQCMGWAEDKTVLLKVIDPEGYEAVQQEVTAMQASLAQRADSLKELIIRENKPPADNFAGDDRQKAIDTAIDAWGYQEKDFEVLGASIPAEAWERQEKQFFDGKLQSDGDVTGTWSKQDRSRLQVQLLIAVKDNPDLAKIIPVNVYKDHMKGDTMIGTPMFAGDEELPPRFFLLRDNIK
ncbi:MAG: hypothetical protein AAF086_02830 [Planctomycetota bacterium]